MPTETLSQQKKLSYRYNTSLFPNTLKQLFLLSIAGAVNGADQVPAYLLGNNTLSRTEIQVPHVPKVEKPIKLAPDVPQLWGGSWSHNDQPPASMLCVMGSLKAWPEGAIRVTELQQESFNQHTLYRIDWRDKQGVAVLQGNLITGCGDLSHSPMIIRAKT